ncbi:MAG: LysR family transcriptional regulator, partial [Clostridiales bacterium]|nr:LysR family transcriptional regulator [Clostridiales bacterium]
FLLNYATDIAGQLGHHFISMGNFKPIVKTQSDNMGMLLELCAAGKGACISPLNLALSSLSFDQQKKMRIIHIGQSAKYKIRFGCLEQPYQWKAIQNFMDAANAALAQTAPTT